MQKRVLEWQIATVTAIRTETPRVKTFTLALPGWDAHRPGQHYDLRLTAPDGYQAQRSYSIASAPERAGEIELTVECVPDGEVSTYLHEVLVAGDRVEVRGPIGGYFVWEASHGGPVLLVGGGSGIVPLMAMARHRAAAGPTVPMRLLYSARSGEDVIYADELRALAARQDGAERVRPLEVFYTFTRQAPEGWRGYARRIDLQMLSEVAAPLGGQVQAFVCGPTRMVEAAAAGLVQLGLPPGQVRTERFGPSGGSG